MAPGDYQFTLQAVNSHHAMREALQDAHEFISALHEMTEDGGDIDKNSHVAHGVTLKTRAKHLSTRLKILLSQP